MQIVAVLYGKKIERLIKMHFGADEIDILCVDRSKRHFYPTKSRISRSFARQAVEICGAVDLDTLMSFSKRLLDVGLVDLFVFNRVLGVISRNGEQVNDWLLYKPSKRR